MSVCMYVITCAMHVHVPCVRVHACGVSVCMRVACARVHACGVCPCACLWRVSVCMCVITCGMYVHTGSAPSELPPSPSLETRGSSKARVLGLPCEAAGAPHLAFFPKGVSLL